MFLVMYYVVFSHFMRAQVSARELSARPGWFPLAMFCGLIPWIGISDALHRSAGCILENGNLIKKFAFPSELLPAYLVGVGLIHSTIGFTVLAAAVLVLHGELPHLPALIPLLFLLQGIFTLGLAFLFSGVTVFIRDVGHMLPMLLNLWFFLSPIFFYARLKTEPILATVLRWNPLTYLIDTWRVVLIYHPEDMEAVIASLGPKDRDRIALWPTPPGEVPWSHIAIFATVAVVVLYLGYRVFMTLKPRFPDEV
jgi:lipopolysaccharide transport system permease protein